MTKIALFVLIGLALMLGSGTYLGANMLEALNPFAKPKPSHQALSNASPEEKRMVSLAEKIAEKLNKHQTLPERSPLGISLLGDSQSANNLSMSQLLETLAIEIGSSKSLGILNILQENLLEEQGLLEQTKSNLPEIAEQATKKLNNLQKENTTLKKELQQTLNKEGFELSEAAIEDLCKSPNGQDHATLLATFYHIKKISKVMEKRLLAFPSTQEAQKYYATQFILLACLDKIQSGLIKNIEEAHIPKAKSLENEALHTLQNAQELAQRTQLPENEKTILETNIKTCEKTQELAQKTQKKLLTNLKILQESREKTRQSLQTAQNSHRTVLLRNELLKLDLTHNQEIESIENLIVPEMLAISFANPERPEILPRLQQIPTERQ
jgi:hypothetical protein